MCCLQDGDKVFVLQRLHKRALRWAWKAGQTCQMPMHSDM